MPKKWTGDLVGMMHNERVTNIQLAEKLGVTDRYVSMVLNGRREPAGAMERFTKAVDEILASRGHPGTKQTKAPPEEGAGEDE